MPAQRKVSYQQIMKIIEFMEKYKDIGLGSSCTLIGHEKYWAELTSELNRIKPGEHRILYCWRRYWVELKSRIRKKLVHGRPLAPFERRLLSIEGLFDKQHGFRKRGNGSTDVKEEAEEIFEEERLEEDVLTEMEYVDNTDTALRDESDDDVYVINAFKETRENINDDPEEVVKVSNAATEQGVPSWVRDVENRRIAVEERTAIAMETVATGISSISESMDRMSRAMVTLVGSIKSLQNSLC